MGCSSALQHDPMATPPFAHTPPALHTPLAPAVPLPPPQVRTAALRAVEPLSLLVGGEAEITAFHALLGTVLQVGGWAGVGPHGG